MKKQKNTKKEPQKNRRARTKYPGIVKKRNLPSRQDYIEPDYISGVLNDKDELVIRPLNQEELEFLNKFYEETISTNFLHNDKLKKLNRMRRKIIEDSVVEELKVELSKAEKAKDKERAKEIRHIIKLTKKQNEEIYADKIQDLEEEMQDLREQHLLYPDKEVHKEFYKENNSRNFCLFNRYKTAFRLDSLDDDLIKNLKSSFYENGEDDIIDEIEREKWEQEEDRLRKSLNFNKSGNSEDDS